MRFLTEPEPPRGAATQVAPGIRRIVAANPGPMTYWGTNTYLLDSPAGTLVVDPGPDDPAHLGLILREAGRIAAIVLTHGHHDHVGALPALRAATGAPVHGWRAPAYPGQGPDFPLGDGGRVGAWQAIFTPGHAPDHLCFAGPGGIVLSGDHVMAWSSTVVGGPGSSMADYFASLHVLLGRQGDALYLPGHGPPLPDPVAYAKALLEHRQAREAAVATLLNDTPAPARALAAALYRDVDPKLLAAAERNVEAHLEKLAGEGRATRTGDGWVR